MNLKALAQAWSDFRAARACGLTVRASLAMALLKRAARRVVARAEARTAARSHMRAVK